MPATGETLRVEGLRELQRAFKFADRDLGLRLRASLKRVAEPVRSDAERLAVAEITRIGIPWSRMRVGVTQTSVYVAPVERGRRSRNNLNIRRPNLADLLMGKAMEPALQKNEQHTEAELQQMLNGIASDWERF